MRSSKWLVFIRSLLAGFDRSLTGPVHFRFLAERANALSVDTLGFLTTFRKRINDFRTVLQHNLCLNDADDAAKQYNCEQWMTLALGRNGLIEQKFWPEPEEWGKLASILREQAKQFFESYLKTISAMSKDEYFVDALEQWILVCDRALPAHKFDRIAEDVASNLGLEHLNILKIRKVNLDKWSQHLRGLPQSADIMREARRIVEITFLAESENHCPIDGQDVIKQLGIEPGPEVAKFLKKAKELYKQKQCGRDELLKLLVDSIDSGAKQ